MMDNRYKNISMRLETARQVHMKFSSRVNVRKSDRARFVEIRDLVMINTSRPRIYSLN